MPAHGSLAIRAVLIADLAHDPYAVRAALAQAGIQLVAAADGAAGIEAVRRLAPEVAIVDPDAPGADVAAVTRTIKSLDPPPGVVIFAMHGAGDDVLAVLAAGADGYCVKSSGTAILVDAVRLAAEGGAYFDPTIAPLVLRRFSRTCGNAANSPLSPRETAVLALVCEGLHNSQIAQRLNVALGTVKRHVEDVLEKLGAQDRAHAAAIALRRVYL